VGFPRKDGPAKSKDKSPTDIWFHIELSHRSKLDQKSRSYIFIGYKTDEYNYRFWDPENGKILRHKDVILNEEKMYKDLLMERSTSKNEFGVEPWRTPKQQGVADSEFVELDDAPVEKDQNILEGNEES